MTLTMTRAMLGALVLTGAATPAQADRFDTVRAAIREQIEDKSVPSVAVAVMQDGKIVWEEGFGWADREKRIAADEHTMYSLASISKPITATGLMTLVQAGKVDLDKPANDYLGAGKLTARVGDARDATVRRVAGHTAGLPLHYQFFYEDEPVARPPMDYTIQTYGNLFTAPGERYQYSNLGYGVLDAIISRVSGVSYADFMRREVFVPLGLTHTSVDIGPGLERFAAMRYGRDGEPVPFYEFDHPGASAVYSSAHDLIRFAGFHLKDHLSGQKAILSDASIDEMHRGVDPQAIRDEGSAYGLGFGTRTKDGYRVVSHSGGMAGVATLMQLFPDRNTAIVVLTNSSSPAPRIIADKIAAVVLPGWKPSPITADEPKAPAFTPSADLVGTWKGTLHTSAKDVPVELTFQPDGLIRAKFGDQLPTIVSRARFDKGFFDGDLNARIPNPETLRYSYSVHLALKLSGTTLNGAATAAGDGDNQRVRNALTHWISLNKQP
ncbi:serine hydrolase domain-containing protein [Sphingomonas colocasiae]|uniref:Beta-lactamase family protein n=1 Tax=Sphingomonas colocasiae TaxID=1848973 RepID=A0ABS7PK14_9SPHN|nr:serine hydrolase domain-containing protein [Sphingomonas colocasiae]MBY8821593.1 beta-lactamase family protein [Sphingomonas colocasiae]